MGKNEFQASYLSLSASGELAARAERGLAALKECRLCPRRCKINRLAGERGGCQTGRLAVVASYGPHFGEESPISGSSGSGTIFFANCNLGCVFCQNYDISHLGEGEEVTPGELAAMMLDLQERGCHNINFVTPSHVVPQILEALVIAVDRGLVVPLVYNNSGYDEVETLQLLAGVIDIYMPDFKFWEKDSARRLAGAADYPVRVRAAFKEMHHQVGDLMIDSRGIARRGLLVRHLVMPGGLEESRKILGFLASEISFDTYVNIMDQYRPCGRANEFPPVDRFLESEEYAEALEMARKAGLTRFDTRNWKSILRRLETL